MSRRLPNSRYINNEDAGDLEATRASEASEYERNRPRPEAVEHPFEATGIMGQAPYAVVGVRDCYRGPIRLADGTSTGAPGQCMDVCRYCSQSIQEVWLVRDANGTVYSVGCSCVKKADTKLAKNPDALRKQRELRREKKAVRDEARIARALVTIEREDVVAFLKATTSAGRPDGLYGYVDFCLLRDNAGVSGKIRCCRIIEKAAKEIDAR